MRIMFAGDTHGNYAHCRYLLEQCDKFNVSTIVQLGDFGYWEHTADGKSFLNELSKTLKAYNTNLVWLDGNHENHAMLRREYFFTKDRTDEGFIPLRDNLAHAPRGLRWEWNGVSFLAMGGAYSVDKEWRKPGSSWWPEETITNYDVEAACQEGNVNVLVSHDCPGGIDLNTHFLAQQQKFIKYDRASEANRSRLRTVVEAVHPSQLFHGHMHLRYDDVLTLDDGWQVHVHGLDCDGSGVRSFTIADLASSASSAA